MTPYAARRARSRTTRHACHTASRARTRAARHSRHAAGGSTAGSTPGRAQCAVNWPSALGYRSAARGLTRSDRRRRVLTVGAGYLLPARGADVRRWPAIAAGLMDGADSQRVKLWRGYCRSASAATKVGRGRDKSGSGRAPCSAEGLSRARQPASPDSSSVQLVPSACFQILLVFHVRIVIN